MRDERLERARKLNGDHARRRCGKEREDVALQGRPVSGQDRLVIWPYARGLGAIGQCDAIFDPDGNRLARRPFVDENVIKKIEMKGYKRKGTIAAMG